MGHAHIYHHVTGRGEAANLPAVHRHVIGQVVATQGQLPKGRCLDVFHKAAGDDFVPLHTGFTGGFVNFFLANAGGVHIGFVRQVHEVVDHQAVIALDVKQSAAISPVRAIGPFQGVFFLLVGLRGVAWPYPNKAVALQHGVTFDGWKTAHPLPRHVHGLAVVTHFQAVIAAHQLALAHLPQRQRRAAVRTKVFQGMHLPLCPPVKHNSLAANGASQRFFVNFIRHTGHIPSVFGKGGRFG